jgi:hypothetical protein
MIPMRKNISETTKIIARVENNRAFTLEANSDVNPTKKVKMIDRTITIPKVKTAMLLDILNLFLAFILFY